MMRFLQNLVHPFAALLLVAWVGLLFGFIWTGTPGWPISFKERGYVGLVPFIFFVIALVVAFLAWAFQVFT
jgi:hypothetical protein